MTILAYNENSINLLRQEKYNLFHFLEAPT